MSQLKNLMLVIGCASSLAFSCSKKKNKNPEFGPLVATTSVVFTQIRGCQNGETVVCEVYTNLGNGITSQICPYSGAFIMDLTSIPAYYCNFFFQTRWSGSVNCIGNQTGSFTPIEPIYVTNAICPF